MNLSIRRVSQLSWLLVLNACGGDTSQDDDARSESDSPAEPTETTEPAQEVRIALSDDNNYVAQSSLSLPSVVAAPAVDLEICWNEIVDDLLCHDFDARSELGNVAFLRLLNTSRVEAEAKLASGQLNMADVDGYLEYQPDAEEDCAHLSDLTLFGTEVDYAEEYVDSEEHTYMFVLSRGSVPGRGAVTMVFVEPDAESDNNSVEAPTGCGLLDFSADLSSGATVKLPAEQPWVLDYRELTRDGLGNSFPRGAADQALIAFYAGMSVADLEERILDLEVIATEMYRVELDGTGRFDLAAAEEENSGELFSGLESDEDGTWVVGMMCGGCQNPAPAFLSVIEVGEREGVIPQETE